MTTISNALRFLPGVDCAHRAGGAAAWAPDAATERLVLLGFALVALAGACAVVVHGLGRVVAFQ